MTRHTCFLLIVLVGLLGCASERPSYQTPSGHPASAMVEAVESPVAATATLAKVEPVAVTPGEAMSMSQHHHQPQPASARPSPAIHDSHAAPATGDGHDHDAHAQPQPMAPEPSHADHEQTRAAAASHDHHASHPADAPAAEPAKPMYVCPMHAEVTSTDANARCSKCGMKLKARVTEEAAK